MNITFIDDPQLYYETCIVDKKIKIMQEYLVDKGITIYDISLHKKGPMEDQLYIHNQFYIDNIRRGNSLAKCIGGKMFFCRRGMKKFFDLELKYFIHENLNEYHSRVLANIMDPIVIAIQKGYTINIYRLFKENGEHCQISYIKTVDQWLIASKNVTILIDKESDLQSYEKERYIWACIIGREWLNVIAGVPNLEALKSLLQHHTLIGEYCGNERYQHITRYPEIKIIFYAVVENLSPRTCISTPEAMKIFKEYNLCHVRYSEVKGLDHIDQVTTELRRGLQEVGEAAMEVEGEGCVAYIEAQNGLDVEVISLCKLKTIEYLIYRKLREILKLLTQGEKVELGKFQREYEIITECFKPPKPMGYYMSLAKLCIERVQQDKTPFELIRYQFVDFIETMQKNIQFQFQQIKPQYMEQVRHTRICIITLPLLLTDRDLFRMRNELGVKQIEGQFLGRQTAQLSNGIFMNQPNFKLIKAISILYLVPKMPHNIKDEQQLEQQIIDHGDTLNIVFLFYGLESQALSLERLQSTIFMQQNPESSSLAVQFTSAKARDREPLMLKWSAKANAYCLEISQSFPTRSSKLNLDGEELITRMKQQYDRLQETVQEVKLLIQQRVMKVVVVYPLLIPGCGKSTLIEFLQEQMGSLICISSDNVTLDLMVPPVNESVQDNQQAEYLKAQPQQREKFNQQLFQTLKKLVESDTNEAVIYMDRVCVPSTLLSCVEQIKAILVDLQMNTSVCVRNLGILPPKPNMSIDDSFYSYGDALTLALRLFNRLDHQTLADDPVYKVKVLCKFLHLLKSVKYSTLKKLNLNRVINLNQFIDQFECDPFIMKILDQCILESGKSRELGDGQCFCKLVELLQQEYKPNINEVRESIKKNACLIMNTIRQMFEQDF